MSVVAAVAEETPVALRSEEARTASKLCARGDGHSDGQARARHRWRRLSSPNLLGGEAAADSSPTFPEAECDPGRL